jgi:hypothetical protein
VPSRWVVVGSFFWGAGLKTGLAGSGTRLRWLRFALAFWRLRLGVEPRRRGDAERGVIRMRKTCLGYNTSTAWMEGGGGERDGRGFVRGETGRVLGSVPLPKSQGAPFCSVERRRQIRDHTAALTESRRSWSQRLRSAFIWSNRRQAIGGGMRLPCSQDCTVDEDVPNNWAKMA